MRGKRGGGYSLRYKNDPNKIKFEKHLVEQKNIGKKELAAAAAIWLLTLGKNRGLVPRHQNWCRQLPKTDESYTALRKHRFMTTFLSYKNSIFWLSQNLILWWKIDFWAWKWVPGHARTIPDHEKPGKRVENPEKPENLGSADGAEPLVLSPI